LVNSLVAADVRLDSAPISVPWSPKQLSFQLYAPVIFGFGPFARQFTNKDAKMVESGERVQTAKVILKPDGFDSNIVDLAQLWLELAI
ncbi:hypothetical protein M8C21_004780, partial [Ambrosia artemisiifolia]